tara:strand:- start:16 stop:378 length:363 start_codon:yes stop_codon:yes gene_type:complete
MSRQIDPFKDSSTIKIIQDIDKLNLSIIQKHHLRILAHCLIILKAISVESNTSCCKSIYLREWCDKQSQKFNDKKFNDILYEQLISTSDKLNHLSKKLNKNIKDLEIDDLIILVQGNSKH